MRQIVKRMLQYGITVENINSEIKSSKAAGMVIIRSEIPGDWKLVTTWD